MLTFKLYCKIVAPSPVLMGLNSADPDQRTFAAMEPAGDV